MKLFLVAFAVIAAVAADVSNEYLPPLQQEAVQTVQTVAAPSNDYLAPVANDEASYGQVEQGSLAQDGYRYKTQRRRVIRRHRRDVNELPSNDYLPPVQEQAQIVAAPSNDYLAPVANDASYAQVEQGNLANDGYRYKTNRRVVYRRNRRDVSHLPSNDYLPPVAQASAPVPSNDYLPPVQTIAAPAPAPVQYAAPAPAPVQYAPVQVAAPAQIVEAAPAHELADDGYRYKTHRRVVYRRHRRDVNELPTNEYLPPVQQDVQTVAAPTNEYLAPVANDVASYGQVEQGSLAQDGYRYKTQRRRVIRRHRRDVNELPSNDYLPPVQEESQIVAAPSNDYLAPVANQASYSQVEQGNLANDGYRYKTHRRVVYRRNRRDVSHLPSNDYLPPVAQASAPVPSNDYLPPVQTIAAPAPAPVQYAAPAPAPVQYAAPAPVQVAAPAQFVEAAPAHELANDGYRYKTHRRVVYRRRH